MGVYHPEDPARFWLPIDAAPEEVQQHIERQDLLGRVLLGFEPPDAIPDLLLSQGENPDEYLEKSIENLERALFIPPDPAELLLWPQSDQD